MKNKKENKKLEKLRINRKINRELQLESGIIHKSFIYKDKTKYDRKVQKKQIRKEIEY